MQKIDLNVQVLDDKGSVVSEHAEEAFVIESKEDLERLFAEAQE